MKDYENRVVKEKEELESKFEKLEEFLMNKSELDTQSRSLLVTQYSIMDAYIRILEMRISNFDK